MQIPGLDTLCISALVHTHPSSFPLRLQRLRVVQSDGLTQKRRRQSKQSAVRTGFLFEQLLVSTTP